jgi:hypothetical protein
VHPLREGLMGRSERCGVAMRFLPRDREGEGRVVTPAEFRGPVVAYSPAPAREEPIVSSGRSGVARFPLLSLACLYTACQCSWVIAWLVMT